VEGLVRDCGEDFSEKSTAAEHIECSTGRTELASHARYNHDIRNARFPACHLARGALGHAFDRDRIWDTRWPRRLRRYLRHEPDGPLRSMSGVATLFDRLARTPWPEASLASSGTSALFSDWADDNKQSGRR
jgi:hypothetical protein